MSEFQLQAFHQMPIKEDIKGASFSTCRKYRFALWRIWDNSKPKLMFIGLNPSKANESENDNTIKRVVMIAKHNGYGGIYMLNAFAFISTNPDDLKDLTFNAANEAALICYSGQAQDVVFAWGDFKVVRERAKELIKMFPDAKALHINKNGSPKHPLYCKKDSPLIDFIY